MNFLPQATTARRSAAIATATDKWSSSRIRTSSYRWQSTTWSTSEPPLRRQVFLRPKVSCLFFVKVKIHFLFKLRCEQPYQVQNGIVLSSHWHLLDNLPFNSFVTLLHQINTSFVAVFPALFLSHLYSVHCRRHNSDEFALLFKKVSAELLLVLWSLASPSFGIVTSTFLT